MRFNARDCICHWAFLKSLEFRVLVVAKDLLLDKVKLEEGVG